MELFLDRDDLALEPRLLPPAPQLLERLRLPHLVAVVVVHQALHVGQVGPRVDGAQGEDGAEQDEDEPLPVGVPVALVDAVHDKDGDHGPELPRRRGDAVARTPVAGREDLGGDDERERVGAKVEGEVAYRDHGHRRGVILRVGHAIVDAAGDDEEDGEDEEGHRQPVFAGEAVREEDEARAARYGAQRDRQQVLLGLLEKHVVQCVAGLGVVRLPHGYAQLYPGRHRGIAPGNTRFPARERRVDG